MNAIRATLAQVHHEWGLIATLKECVAIPGALSVFLLLAGLAGLFDHG